MNNSCNCFLLILMLLMVSQLYAMGQKEYSVPIRSINALELEAPIERWDEAIPLGNGISGILMWGDQNKLKLSLDRADLWDNRISPEYLVADWNYSNIISLVKRGDLKQAYARYDTPYDKSAYPTKLPGGRLEINLGNDNKISNFKVDFQTGIGTSELQNGGEIKVIMCQNLPAAIVVLDNAPEDYSFLIPGQKRGDSGSMAYASFSDLNYPKATIINKKGITGFIQHTATNLSYMISEKSYDWNGKKCMAIAMISGEFSVNSEDKLFQKSEIIFNKILAKTPEYYLEESIAWWKKFNFNSSVSINDKGILHQYNFVKYLYGAGARVGAPPMPLQGVWTADSEGLPPWKGDFHFDLNVQMNYWGCYTAGLKGSSKGLTDFTTSLIPVHKKFAEDFYGAKNAIAIPGVMTLDGKPMGGWLQYSFSPTNGIWMAQHYYWEWKFFNSSDFLSKSAYPYCNGIANTVLELLTEDENGNLKLPLSSSPEIFNNSARSWLEPNSNYDQSLLIWLFAALEEMSIKLKNGESQKWANLSSKLNPLVVDKENILMFSSNEKFSESHRHHSHLMGIYPLQLLDPQGEHRDIVLSSLDKMKQFGGKQWTGYSFSWAACLEAIAGRASNAEHYLSLFGYAFVSRNGFHLNGDQKGTRESEFVYRPFTLEGNFAAMQAVHLMLIQNRGELVTLFPAVPISWTSPSFEKLRVYGGMSISASMKGEIVDSLVIQSESSTELLLSLERISQRIVDKLLQIGTLEVTKNGVQSVRILMDSNSTIIF